ncbi:hypothetical protein HN51_065620 [Arachis hypogaea]
MIQTESGGVTANPKRLPLCSSSTDLLRWWPDSDDGNKSFDGGGCGSATKGTTPSFLGQGYGKKAGHSMFFLENIFVPPIKFRPPTKGGDMVSEHAHTVLLSKILQSNIRLGDVHLNKKDPSMVLARWVELQ